MGDKVAKWMPIAQSYVGQKEVKGGENPVILGYFEAVGHGWVKEDEVPWCAAFVGGCLEEAGYKSTGSLAARSYLDWGQKVTQPQYGDVVVFWRGSKKSWQGHVAFYVRETDKSVVVLGGNQGNKVSVTTYPKSRVLGYRRPSTLSNSRTVTGVGGVATGVAVDQSMDIVRETQNTLLGFPVEYVQYLGIGLAIVSLALILYARRDDILKKGR